MTDNFIYLYCSNCHKNKSVLKSILVFSRDFKWTCPECGNKYSLMSGGLDPKFLEEPVADLHKQENKSQPEKDFGMKDFVWIIGGGIMQEPMLDEVHCRGFNAIVSDRNPDCYLFSKLGPFDWKIICDTYDTVGHAKHAQGLPKGLSVRAVVSPGADVGPTTSAIAETLGLRAVPYEIAKNVRDKATMRWKLGFDHPRFDTFLVAVDTAWDWWLRKDGLPCIVKPADNCATRGISVAHDKSEFLTAVTTALKFNKQSNSVVVEEMLIGSEVALDFLIVDGEAVWANGVNRLFRHHKPGHQGMLFGIEGAVINPFGPQSGNWDNLGKLATTAAQRLGVTEGPFKIDALKDERYGWCILECATRWSGGHDHTSLAPMVGRDLTSVLLDYALNLEPVIPPVLPNRYSAEYMPYYPPQLVKRWEWLLTKDQLLEQYHIHHVFIRAEHEIGELRTCADRASWFLASGDSWLGALRNAYRGSKFVVPIPEDLNGSKHDS